MLSANCARLIDLKLDEPRYQDAGNPNHGATAPSLHCHRKSLTV